MQRRFAFGVTIEHSPRDDARFFRCKGHHHLHFGSRADPVRGGLCGLPNTIGHPPR
jgi:hypothetical protein